MDPAAAIRSLGFRRWYERQLIYCHLALVTCLLCGLTVAALLEQVDLLHFGFDGLLMIAIVFAAGIVGWFSWRHYITLLRRAERYGESSTCPQCHAYGRFAVESSGVDTVPDPAARAVAPLESAWLRVRCRLCGSQWRMPGEPR